MFRCPSRSLSRCYPVSRYRPVVPVTPVRNSAQQSCSRYLSLLAARCFFSFPPGSSETLRSTSGWGLHLLSPFVVPALGSYDAQACVPLLLISVSLACCPARGSATAGAPKLGAVGCRASSAALAEGGYRNGLNRRRPSQPLRRTGQGRSPPGPRLRLRYPAYSARAR